MLNIEKKRMNYVKNLSLAQKLGLIDRPELPLSLTEWKQIEQRYLVRTKQEKENTCPICFEDLGMGEQKILCCSHVFHKQCLDSFEKIAAQRGMSKACPICRKENYDYKLFTKGQMRFLLKIIVKMQGLVRGFLQRNSFYGMMKEASYKPKVEVIRKRFIGWKLGRINKRYFDHMKAERAALYDRIKDIDKNIESTEALLNSLLPNISKLFKEKQDKKAQNNKGKETEKLSKFW